jgi:hypothetical protein
MILISGQGVSVADVSVAGVSVAGVSDKGMRFTMGCQLL